MTKIAIEFLIPGLIALYVAVTLVKIWYMKVFPAGIRDYKDVQKASAKYESEIKKGRKK